MDSAIAVKGAVESGLARELAVTLVHAPPFESKVGIQIRRKRFREFLVPLFKLPVGVTLSLLKLQNHLEQL